MKYIKLSILLVLLTSIGCNVLEQEPQTAISEEIAIRDLKSAEAALNGLYDQLQSANYYGNNLQIMSDVASDITQSVGTWDFYREMDTFTTAKSNTENRNLWFALYQTVNHANNLIAKVPDLADVSQADKDRVLGESYFIRALAYFDLTRTYGGVIGEVGTLGVPLVTTPTSVIDDSSYPARSTLQASYDQVKADLTQAESLLSGFNSAGRVSEAAVKALFSRYYLYVKDYTNTEVYATDVIDNYGFELTPTYAEIFENENTKEAIFELQYNTTDGNSLRFWHVPSAIGGRGDIAMHVEFAEMIKARPTDTRGDLLGFDSDVGVYYPAKYNKAGGDDNIQILRLAEMYLNRAEARANKSPIDAVGALADLNKIRNRAGLVDTVGVGVVTKEQILLAIEKERGIEFILEGHRWYDLMRTGRAMTVMMDIPRKNGPDVTLPNKNYLLFPIPSRDMEANPNLAGQQNEAYK